MENKQNDQIKLDDRMKIYEKELEQNILPYFGFIVRLDGKNFSKFTKGFRKPFDNVFETSMIWTMNDMITKFNARTGYTHSDEITIIFSSVCTKEEFEKGENKSTHEYNGRIMKLCSIFASYCVNRFSYHLRNLTEKNKGFYKDAHIEKINGCEYSFDARIIVFPEDKQYEYVNHMIWRSIYDCYRNCISAYAQKYFSHKEIDGKTTKDMLQMLNDKYELKEEDIPIFHKHGVYGKRELYKIEVEIDGEKKEAIRQKITNRCFKITSNQNDLLLQKNWPDEFVEYKGISISSDGCIKLT